MILRGEMVIDALAGMSLRESKELIALRGELFDKEGNPIEFNKEEEIHEAIVKGNRFCQLMIKRNELWLAKLN